MTNPQSSTQDLLSKVSRYEALFELTGVINAAASIEAVGRRPGSTAQVHR